MVTDFSGENKASSIILCAVVCGRPGQEIFYFGELCSPEAQNRTNQPVRIGICRYTSVPFP